MSVPVALSPLPMRIPSRKSKTSCSKVVDWQLEIFETIQTILKGRLGLRRISSRLVQKKRHGCENIISDYQNVIKRIILCQRWAKTEKNTPKQVEYQGDIDSFIRLLWGSFRQANCQAKLFKRLHEATRLKRPELWADLVFFFITRMHICAPCLSKIQHILFGNHPIACFSSKLRRINNLFVFYLSQY